MEGVNTYEVDNYLVSTPFGCPIGSYCLVGSDLVIGSGLCPIGYFCPAQTEFLEPAPPRSYTGNFGAVGASLCTPGTFQLFFTGSKCERCPSGYECQLRGTSMPSICPIGSYRSVIESNVCQLCPKGTFAFERGVMDFLGCNECPTGRICEEDGLRNITMTARCTDG